MKFHDGSPFTADDVVFSCQPGPAAVAEIFARPRHPYTRMLLDAVPDLAMSGEPRTPVAGEVPNPLAPPPGCAFHPRCPHASERCRRERPQTIAAVACHAVQEGRI